MTTQPKCWWPSRCARERAFLDAVAKNPIHIQLLTSEPLAPVDRRAAPVALRTLPGADPDIAALMPAVTTSTLSTWIANLSGEQAVRVNGSNVTLATRYTFSGQVDSARAYLHASLAALGLDVSDVAWSYGSYGGVNVVADLRGASSPEKIWLVGGHFDDTSQTPYTRAPGADDNASGIAAMLVIADIVHTRQFSDTIRFVAFSGEEQGMWGSKSYAGRLRSSDAQVMGYIDLDMWAGMVTTTASSSCTVAPARHQLHWPTP